MLSFDQEGSVNTSVFEFLEDAPFRPILSEINPVPTIQAQEAIRLLTDDIRRVTRPTTTQEMLAALQSRQRIGTNRVLMQSGKSAESSNNTERNEALVDQQIMEDSGYLQDMKDDRIMLVDNHNMSLSRMVEIMRGAGARLSKCLFRTDIQEAITLLERTRQAIRVFFVDYELLAQYIVSKNEDISCFVR
jgi:hypothetical protein